MKIPRIYLDTSVFGGCFDEEFAKESLRLIEEIKAGRFLLLISKAVVAEVDRAPAGVQKVLADIPEACIERLVPDPAVNVLMQAYLDAQIVGPASATDAEHIAAATVARADMIVSWNFKHIVNLNRIHGFNAVNLKEGYRALEIRNPNEVIYE